MNKRIKKKREKQKFLQYFSKEDWKFYRKYPKLFTVCKKENIPLWNVDYWYKKFSNMNKDEFQLLVRMVYAHVTFDEKEMGFKPYFPNLCKYDFKYLMDNIDDYSIFLNEKFPRRIRYRLNKYLKLKF